MSFYQVDITDGTGHIISETVVNADNLLDAGIMAEDILEQYHLKHPCKRCLHDLRVIFDSMKGDTK